MTISRRTLLGASMAAALPLPSRAAVPSGGVAARFPIWNGPAPGGEGLAVKDEFVMRSANGGPDDIAWPHVATPMLNVLPAAKPNGAAVLMIAGGGYARVALGRQGSSISRMFNERGVTAFELLYRLPHDGWAAGPDAPLQDAQRAMRLIRAGAATWGIDPDRIAAIGFSAGGHLAARLASRFALETYRPMDATDRLSARPRVAGLFFPVITMAGDVAHAPSRRELIGRTPDAATIERYSAERDLPADMPPTFVAHAADDPVVKAANSLTMFGALQAAKIPSELMIFETGGHNLPLIEDGRPHPWPDLFDRFAKRHGW
ncbi:alpha/beta hydrolase [Sphingomonas sp. BGYR3]|uniref:alpha/beta hydrolase n=1 Tax=Sphingomonas sp. BGYR3 TaxID=2975483 RepID=UPI0021A2E441|nr:alpha/beta hydrolase [Sphingomonas sp. BGYR3]MDG5489758.1 alpha/beta hydrolase [Sphingomonas sp. BGYR3]